MNRGPVVREGYIYIAAALFLAVVMYFGFGVAVAVPFVVLACYFTYFFRNPDRTIPTDEHLVVSPADGTVQDVVELEDDDFVKGP